jgi:hypothetical protein
VRGQTLVWFLRKYLGRRAVACQTPAQFARAPVAADRVLLGLPTSLEPEQIQRIDCRELVPFDYLDAHELAWTVAQEAVLRTRVQHYLKPWFEPTWDYDLQMGLLPIRRYGRFSTALAIDRWLGRTHSSAQRKFDVAFLGRPNATRFYVDGRIEVVEQRVEWVLQLKREAPELSFCGGLVEVDPQRQAKLEQRFGDLSDVWYAGEKVNFARYFRSLHQARVLLAPGGNVPWTYRHYECLYSGAVVVTLDYRQRDMLVPLPREQMVHVSDGEPVLPAVREALERSSREPELPARVYEHLERYFSYGRYGRRPALWERFEGQLR